MNKANPALRARRPTLAALDALIEEISVDAYDENEQLWAFRQAFEDEVAVPCNAFVIGEPVSVVEFDYDGNERRGLTAKCRCPDGREYVVSLHDVAFSRGEKGAIYVAAYRKWMGLPPFLPETTAPHGRKTRPEAVGPAIDLRRPVELAVLSAKRQTARCRILGIGETVTLRSRRHWVPGEIVRVKPRKPWNGDPHLSGEVVSSRIDAALLGLVPLRLEDRGTWNPAEEYWREEGEPIEPWARPIVARGTRPSFEMEQVLPGYNYEDPDCDPIGISNDCKDSGNAAAACKILMDLCEADLRCLDAHAHLGNLAFDPMPYDASRHYEIGFRIGELSLPNGFNGVLRWGHIDNRPFLRCMHGFGLCLWRLGRFTEALELFERMLLLNPSDNQGARFLLADVRAKRLWENRREK